MPSFLHKTVSFPFGVVPRLREALVGHHAGEPRHSVAVFDAGLDPGVLVHQNHGLNGNPRRIPGSSGAGFG